MHFFASLSVFTVLAVSVTAEHIAKRNHTGVFHASLHTDDKREALASSEELVKRNHTGVFHASLHTDDKKRDLSVRDSEPSGSNARFTYFADGLGACGATNTPSDFIVALNSGQFDNGAHCFKMIEITIGGKSTQAQITDECPGCPSDGGLDFSEGLFKFFAPESVGVLSGDWNIAGAGAPAPTKSKWVAPTTKAWVAEKKTSSTHTTTSTTKAKPTSTKAKVATTSAKPTTTTHSSTSTTPTSTNDAAETAGTLSTGSYLNQNNEAFLGLTGLLINAAAA